MQGLLSNCDVDELKKRELDNAKVIEKALIPLDEMGGFCRFIPSRLAEPHRSSKDVVFCCSSVM